MAVSKVDVNGVTVLDLTQDSVTPETLKKGETAHDKSGAPIVGEMESAAPKLQSKAVSYTENGTATITPDAGYDGLSSVDVEVNVSGGGSAELVTLTIKASGPSTWDIICYAQNESGVFEITGFGTYTVLKNSMVICMGGSSSDTITGGTQMYYSAGTAIYQVTSNATIRTGM